MATKFEGMINQDLLEAFSEETVVPLTNLAGETADRVSTLESSKVDKQDGMGLSEANFTAAEKEKLSSIANGAQPNAVTGVKGAMESEYREGNVSLSPENIGAAEESHVHDGRYYTEEEVNALLGTKADSAHGAHVTADTVKAALGTDEEHGNAFLRKDGTWQVVRVPDTDADTKYTLVQDATDKHRFTFSGTDGTSQTFTIPDSDTEYNNATQSTAGLMSASDKVKLDGAEAASNKVTSLSSSSTDTQYPSAKAVYSAIQSASGTDKDTTDLTKMTGILPIEHGGTGNADGYIRTGQKLGTTAAKWSTIDGVECTAYGFASHAEGHSTTTGENGSNTGMYAHAEGNYCSAVGPYSHAEGFDTVAYQGHSEGSGTVANDIQLVVGYFNIKSDVANKDRFVVGNGVGDLNRSNAFRVTDSAIYGTGAYNSTGADYAEYFEWADGNPDNEDRRGRFVVLYGDKIMLADKWDDPFGIVSAAPTVVGDAYDDQWKGMYVCDVFGAPVFEDVELEAVLDDEGNVLVPARTRRQMLVNRDYDKKKRYVPRSMRPEWDAVGMIGKIVMVDDGESGVNDCVMPDRDGIATRADRYTRFRVMRRLDGFHILVAALP